MCQGQNEDDEFVQNAGKFGCCAKFQRLILLLGNFFLFVMSICICAFAFMMTHKPNPDGTIRGVPTSKIPGFDLLGDQARVVIVMMGACGVFLFILAFFGCYGSLRKNRTMLLIYASVLFLMMCLEMAAVGVAFKMISGEAMFKELVCTQWNKAEGKIKIGRDNLEMMFGCRCCAVDYVQDMSVTYPGNCPSGATIALPNFDTTKTSSATNEGEGGFQAASIDIKPAKGQVKYCLPEKWNTDGTYDPDSTCTEVEPTLIGCYDINENTALQADADMHEYACLSEGLLRDDIKTLASGDENLPGTAAVWATSGVVTPYVLLNEACEWNANGANGTLDGTAASILAAKCAEKVYADIHPDWEDNPTLETTIEAGDVPAWEATCEGDINWTYWDADGNEKTDDSGAEFWLFKMPCNGTGSTATATCGSATDLVFDSSFALTEDMNPTCCCRDYTAWTTADSVPIGDSTDPRQTWTDNIWNHFMDLSASSGEAIYVCKRGGANEKHTCASTTTASTPAGQMLTYIGDRRRMMSPITHEYIDTRDLVSALQGATAKEVAVPAAHRQLAAKPEATGGQPPNGSFCYGVVKRELLKNFKIIAGIGFVTVCYQVFGTLFACVVANAIKKSKKEKEEARKESIARMGPGRQ